MPARLTLTAEWLPLPAIVAQSYFMASERAMDMSTPMGEVVQIFGSEIDMNFQVEGRPSHWDPLAPSTLAKKLSMSLGPEGRADVNLGTSEYKSSVIGAAIGSMKILRDTGTLYDAATDPNSWVISTEGTTTVAELEDVTGYGIYHVEGTSTPMPQRDYTYISDEALDEAENTFADWIMEE